MEKPPRPPDEAERLEALRRLNVLDSPCEFRFDRITRLAALSIGTQFAEINLIDEDRQWSKSQYGTRKREKPRNESFCAHAIHEDDILVIPDARKDSRFRDNPSVKRFPNIRFYMSHPIKSPDGYIVGTLCVFDPDVQSPTSEDRKVLRDLADLVEDELTKWDNPLPELTESPVDYGEIMGDIHHQVRNNLQTILSLLNLEKMNVDEEATKRSYEKTERRTRVVALLYDCLIETDEDIRVDMATYLEFIVQEIIQVERPPGALEFDIELERAEMSIERAPVCGLLIHELVMNAVRHVYNGEQHGTVRVEFHPLEDSEDDDYHFLVADDGRGLPGDFDWRNDGSVGMKLIRNITEQKFGGTLKCTVDNGTTFEGSF